MGGAQGERGYIIIRTLYHKWWLNFKGVVEKRSEAGGWGLVARGLSGTQRA